MINKVIFITLLLTIFSCSQNENRSQVEHKKEKVMEIHDIAMEKMGEMAKLKSELKAKLTTDSANSEKINTAIQDLIKADELMWDWMHNYHHEIVDTSQIDSALKYLEIQHKEVLKVEEKINSSLKNGKALL